MDALREAVLALLKDRIDNASTAQDARYWLNLMREVEERNADHD